MDNGTVAGDNPTSFNVETETFTLINPTRAGYTFIGWSTTSPLSNPDPQMTVTIEKGSSGNKYYYANWGLLTSVSSPDRAAPVTPSEEAVVVAPAGVLASGFTVGPNIIGKVSGGVVTIYRVGSAIGCPRSAGDNVLAVYDATGNVVKKILISDNASVSSLYPPFSGNGSPRRSVGQWDLRDARGRVVSEGTYLLRGVVRTADGGRERVSLPVSVR